MIGNALGQTIDATLLLKELGATATALVGSTYTLGTGQDIDILARVPSMALVAAKLNALGWLRDGNPEYAADGFISMRKGDVNALLCENEDFFGQNKLAAEVCKALKLAEKKDRVAVHRVIRDGRKADDPNLFTL